MKRILGGGRGIRTPGGREPTVVFKTTALVRSAIPPGRKGTYLSGGNPSKRADCTISERGMQRLVILLLRAILSQVKYVLYS